ncbi:hypothetical protein ACOJQI_01765 [Bacillus salacetis]|uniref:hypothetical protein n=1 Tax=Bacillus salacetis TaxID=2315464 RepID=UPI003BA322FC
MINRVSLLIVISMIFFSQNNNPVLSNGLDGNQSNQDIYREIGYTTVDAAAEQFEKHFKQRLKLPLRVPPIAFTHIMGRVNDLEGSDKDSFEVKYINVKNPDNHYKINIRPVQHKLQYKNEEINKGITLKDGNKAVYLNHSGFNVLVFEKGSWQYMLSINKKAADMMLPGTLVQIANSIEAQES